MTRLTSAAVTVLAVTVALATSPSPADCQAAGQERVLDIRGFGGWAAGHTSNDNLYPDSPAPIASSDVALDNTYFTLNLLAKPAEKVAIHAQPTWQSDIRGHQLTLDLAYAELTIVKDLRLRLGKIRNPLGLYTEIYKVGTLRPFYLLPNAYYRLVPESYLGAGLNRVQPLGSWEVELDVFGGQMDFHTSDVDMMVGFDPVAMQPQYASVPVTARGRDVVGGGAFVRPPIEGLEVGVSAYSFKLYGSVAGTPFQQLAEERQKAYAGSLEYVTEKLSLRTEALFARGYEVDDSFYVEAAYKLTSRWQVAATYEYGNYKEPPPLVSALSKHNAVGLGLNYWVNPTVVLKLDYYHVVNNRSARPADAINLALSGNLDKNTDVIIGGLNFAF